MDCLVFAVFDLGGKLALKAYFDVKLLTPGILNY